jgi:hypothetical protein
LPRRPELRELCRSLFTLLLAPFLLGPGWELEVRFFGLVFSAIAVVEWRRYWRAYDEFKAWQKRFGR